MVVNVLAIGIVCLQGHTPYSVHKQHLGKFVAQRALRSMAGGVIGKRYHQGPVGEIRYKGARAPIQRLLVAVPIVSEHGFKRFVRNVAPPGAPVLLPPSPVLKPTTVPPLLPPKTVWAPLQEPSLMLPARTARKWLLRPSSPLPP